VDDNSAELLFKALFTGSDCYIEIRALDGDIVKQRRFFKLPEGIETAARHFSGLEVDVLFGAQPRMWEGEKNGGCMVNQGANEMANAMANLMVIQRG